MRRCAWVRVRRVMSVASEREPHPDDAVRRKFLDLAAPVWGQGRAEALYGRVLDLDGVPDVAALAGDAGL